MLGPLKNIPREGVVSDRGARGSVLLWWGASEMLGGEDGRPEALLSAVCLTPPLPLGPWSYSVRFYSTGPGATPSSGIFRHFSVVFRIISHHLQGSFSFSRAPSITV